MPTGRRQDPLPIEIRKFTPEDAEAAIGLLTARVGEVNALDPKAVSYRDERVRAIERRIRSTILEVFGENSAEYRDHQYHEIRGGRGIRVVGYGEDPRYAEAERQQDFTEGIPRTVTMLESLVDTVRERTTARRAVGAIVESPGPDASANRVFIVHGRSEGPREAVARFVMKLGFEPIILQEQASEGRTIIEKFEHHSGVGFAVVLLTGDDRGGPADADPDSYEPRARQNVILELGYFVGKLGRRRVAVLYEAGVEIPSDFHGVVYIPLDAREGWRLLLANEMKAAGFDVDLNKAF